MHPAGFQLDLDEIAFGRQSECSDEDAREN
jgi:hypothetical protein